MQISIFQEEAIRRDVKAWWEAAFFGTLDPEVVRASGADMLRHYVRSGALDRSKAREIAYKYHY
jgi:hypothetical protein